MRKTSLFTLPEQNTKNSMIENHHNNNNIDDISKYDDNNDLLKTTRTQEDSITLSPASSSSLATYEMVIGQSTNHDVNAFTNQGFQEFDEISNQQQRSLPSSSTSQDNNEIRCSMSQEDCNTIDNNSTTNTNTNTINNSNNIDSNQKQNLTHLDIIHDILRNSSQDSNIQGRPRQFGRRNDQHPRIISIMAETNPLSGNQRIIVNHDRPSSAPAATTIQSSRTTIIDSNINTTTTTATATATNTTTSESASSSLIHNNRNTINSALISSNSSRYIGSEPSSVISSRNPSPVSLISSTASSSTNSAVVDQTTNEKYV